jgi:iron complex outermembrane receptor protein
LGNTVGNIPTSVLDTNFSTTSNVVLSDIVCRERFVLRMDNITLGYTFPKWLEGKASLRLFAGMQNVFVIQIILDWIQLPITGLIIPYTDNVLF